MAPAKGKVGTRGQKQIFEENTATLKFYFNIMAGSSLAYIVVRLLWWLESFSWVNWLLLIFASAVYVGCYQFMASMAKPHHSQTGALIDGGLDLNMESGMAEHIKDIILMTAIVEVLAILWDYFWLLWLIVPGRAFYILWVNILAPWIFAAPPEVDEKKQKKMERRMNRKY